MIGVLAFPSPRCQIKALMVSWIDLQPCRPGNIRRKLDPLPVLCMVSRTIERAASCSGALQPFVPPGHHQIQNPVAALSQAPDKRLISINAIILLLPALSVVGRFIDSPA